jgi:hypothetical protein
VFGSRRKVRQIRSEGTPQPRRSSHTTGRKVRTRPMRGLICLRRARGGKPSARKAALGKAMMSEVVAQPPGSELTAG